MKNSEKVPSETADKICMFQTKVLFRCAEDIETLENTEWSQSFETGADISGLNLKGYVQYKLELGATCGCGTPRVTEVTVDFE